MFDEYDDLIHLDHAMNWLSYAQDFHKSDAGVAAIYYFKSGWQGSYPETSGYIVGTYFSYADMTGDISFIKRAIEIGDWEISIQANNGGIYSDLSFRNIAPFNTGQVILGWCLLFERTGERRFLDAAIRAGDYLVSIQENDGTWILGSYCGARTYEARVDWALLRLAKLTDQEVYRVTAINNLRWIVSKQKENGWFECCGFNNELPITHTIIYTVRGLLECFLTDEYAVKEFDLLSSVRKTIDSLCIVADTQHVKGIPGMLPRAYDEKWNGTLSDSCLTGNAQFAVLLYRFSHLVEDNKKYLVTADKVLSAIKKTQVINSPIKDICGAIPGSYPIYRGYVSNGYPNWAAKFIADALMMKIGFAERIFVRS